MTVVGSDCDGSMGGTINSPQIRNLSPHEMSPTQMLCAPYQKLGYKYETFDLAKVTGKKVQKSTNVKHKSTCKFVKLKLIACMLKKTKKKARRCEQTTEETPLACDQALVPPLHERVCLATQSAEKKGTCGVVCN